MGLWERLEARLRAVDPGLAGLRPGAGEDRLAELDVPGRWWPVWGGHDGQTGGLDGLFEGWFFLPLEGEHDSVREELDRLPPSVRDQWFPLAKDFSGEIWVVERETGRVLHVDGETVVDLVANGPEQLLARAVAGWDRDGLPRTWSVGDDGRWQRDGEPEIVLGDLAGWAPGEHRPLVDGLVAVRLVAAAVLGEDDLPDERRHLVFAVDAADGDAGSRGRVVSVVIEGASGLVLANREELWWLEAERLPPGTRLRIKLDPGGRAAGTGPLARLARAKDGRERARALFALGSLANALEALDGGGRHDPELRAELLLGLGRGEEAIEEVRPGSPARIRALSSIGRHDEAIAEARARADETRALPDRWLLATVLEASGDEGAACAELEGALAARGTFDRERAPRVAARLRGLRAKRAPRATAPVLADEELVDDVVLEEGPTAIVALTPGQAASGVLAKVPFPEGAVGVRLPKGAGHGLRARFAGLAPDGADLVVEVRLRLPADWTAEGCANDGLSFDRWDVIARVPRPKGRVRVAGLDGEHVVEWPAGVDEVRVDGAGLARPKGGRGDLVVRAGEARRTPR